MTQSGWSDEEWASLMAETRLKNGPSDWELEEARLKAGDPEVNSAWDGMDVKRRHKDQMKGDGVKPVQEIESIPLLHFDVHEYQVRFERDRCIERLLRF